MIIMHRELLLINEVIASLFGLELKLLGISFTPYCANTGQIPVKTLLRDIFLLRYPLIDSDAIKSVRVGGKN